MTAIAVARQPARGDTVEFRLWGETEWRSGRVLDVGSGSKSRILRDCVMVSGHAGEWLPPSDGDGRGWRWPARAVSR